jgi:hypothetical protein
MTGILKQSYVYSGKTAQKRDLLTNDQGRVIAYVVPSEAGVEARAESLFNKKGRHHWGPFRQQPPRN